jgi:iron-siderophore ABC transporter, inner membrane subunit
MRQQVVFANRMLRLSGARFGIRIALRPLLLQGLLGLLALILAGGCLLVGDYPLTPAQVLDAFLGDRSFTRVVVLEWRLPAAASAVVFGALLGTGGAIFQSLTRNPLGSPDVIGFDAGAHTAVVVGILLFGARAQGAIALAAVIGGLLAAYLVHLLSGRTTTGFRLIVVGLAVSATLGAINSYLITRARVEDAMLVGFWGAGSLARVEAESLPAWLAVAAALLVSAGLLAPSLGVIELGDQTAGALGIPLESRRALLVVVGVASSAVVTAAAGPIGFVALAAPQVARRLMRTPGISIPGAAVTGAALLSAAQLCSALASNSNRPIPVGLITVSVGGLYLIHLLIRDGRRVT